MVTQRMSGGRVADGERIQGRQVHERVGRTRRYCHAFSVAHWQAPMVCSLPGYVFSASQLDDGQQIDVEVTDAEFFVIKACARACGDVCGAF